MERRRLTSFLIGLVLVQGIPLAVIPFTTSNQPQEVLALRSSSLNDDSLSNKSQHYQDLRKQPQSTKLNEKRALHDIELQLTESSNQSKIPSPRSNTTYIQASQVSVPTKSRYKHDADSASPWGDESIIEGKDQEILALTSLHADPPITMGDQLIPLVYEVKPGDTLSGIWKNIGGESQQANAAADAFNKADVSLSTIQAGETLEFLVDVLGQVHTLKKSLTEGKVLLLTASEDGSFEPEIIVPKIIRTERIVTGDIQHSLAQASLRRGIPYEVVDDFVDLFSGRVEFSRDVQPGDSFTVIYEERNSEEGVELSPGPIQAASFMNNGELYVAIRYDSPEGPHYYDQKGNPLGNHFLRYPLKYTRISSMFTRARFHPVLKSWRPHNGVDFAAPTGTPVRSVADGVVSSAGYSGGNGNMVKIKHGDKYATAYLHLSKITKGLRSGSRVKRGDIIGAVGSTGLATGPHLHYSFYVNDKYVDPMSVKLPTLPDNLHPIPEKYLRSTLRKLKRQHKELQLALVSGEPRSHDHA
ncbi:MAG: peptidoglycan DD-metalloendopeptidase family protein [Bdellovibrionales bacterium]|nr:peptidoglycan DD-metalloendopeptidase family protein [Bdellovibrionales bacterium]